MKRLGGRKPFAQRRWPRAFATAVATIATAVGVTLATRGAHGSSHPSFTPPSGWQPVSYRGVQLYVPASWRLTANNCATGPGDTLIRTAERQLSLDVGCPTDPPSATVVRMATSNSVDHEALTFVSRQYPFASSQWEGAAPDGRLRVVLLMPDEGVGIDVASPDPAIAQRILTTVRPVSVDAFGCASVSDTGAPPSSTAKPPLALGTPTSVVACAYTADHRLLGGGRVASSDIDSFLARLTSAFASPRQTSSAIWVATPSTVLLRPSYAHGSDRVLRVEMADDCDVSISEGKKGWPASPSVLDVATAAALSGGEN